MAGGDGTYIAFRLSGSTGTLLERTTFAFNNQQPSILEGIVQLNSGSSVTLQYVTSGSAEITWYTGSYVGVGTDKENMRTGEVSMFRIADPMTVNNLFGQPGYVAPNYAFATSNLPFTVSSPGFNNVTNVLAKITTSGSPVLITVNASWFAQTNNAATAFTLARNSTNIGDPNYGLATTGPRLQGYQDTASLFYVDFPPAGTYTYAYQASSLTGSGIINVEGNSGPTSMMLWEMKNANVVTASSKTPTTITSTSFTQIRCW
jgi:hypothetical protein